MLGKILIALAGYVVVGRTIDVPVRRALAAQKARRLASLSGKPMLNVGSGFKPGGSPNGGKTLFGDVNCDYRGSGPCLADKTSVCQCDVNALPFPDKTFGSVLASHLLEHLEDPDKARRELERVCVDPKNVVVVTPLWWLNPLGTFLTPDHKWIFKKSGNGTGPRVAYEPPTARLLRESVAPSVGAFSLLIVERPR